MLVPQEFSTNTRVVRDWRVVSIPDEDSRSIDVATLFFRILDHVYDLMEPFNPYSADKKAAIYVEVGSSQAASFQGVPLSASIAELVAFGSYLKFYILHEDQVSTVSLKKAHLC